MSFRSFQIRNLVPLAFVPILLGSFDASLCSDPAVPPKDGDPGGAGGIAGAGASGGGSGGEGGSVDELCMGIPCPDTDPCWIEACVSGECEKTDPEPIGTLCPDGVCDGQGNCAPCDDAAENCLGSPCSDGTGCASGNCVDGYCCVSACTETCFTCSLPGQQGACTATLDGVTDEGTCAALADCGAQSGQTCVCDHENGSGMPPTCAATAKVVLGRLCADDADCHSGVCSLGTCRLEDGQPCDDNVVCASNHCSAGACQPCDQDAQCASGACSGGKCLGDWGEPCGVADDCVGAECIGNLCKTFSGSCVDDGQCSTGHCESMNCAPCANGTECESMTCNNGVCDQMAGTYCVVDSTCASTSCEGFPARCE